MKTKIANNGPRLKRLLPSFRKLRIGVLGDLMLDRYVWGNANRLSPEADFAAYAATRISGAILGELRRTDWMSRAGRSKAGCHSSAKSKLET